MWSHRVLRHTVFICASRSLSVQASASRSSVPPHHSVDDKGGGGTLVFIDVENINTVRYTAWHTPPPLMYSMQLFGFNKLKLCFNLPPLVPRVTLVCGSSTSSRCPAAVRTGAFTGASTQPRIKVCESSVLCAAVCDCQCWTQLCSPLNRPGFPCPLCYLYHRSRAFHPVTLLVVTQWNRNTLLYTSVEICLLPLSVTTKVHIIHITPLKTYRYTVYNTEMQMCGSSK